MWGSLKKLAATSALFETAKSESCYFPPLFLSLCLLYFFLSLSFYHADTHTHTHTHTHTYTHTHTHTLFQPYEKRCTQANRQIRKRQQKKKKLWEVGVPRCRAVFAGIHVFSKLILTFFNYPKYFILHEIATDNCSFYIDFNLKGYIIDFVII